GLSGTGQTHLSPYVGCPPASLCDGVVCTAQDQCHVAGTCDPGTGQCTSPVAANGTTCNDNDACTQTDTCQNGACVGSNPGAWTASDQCHNAGTCNSATGQCSNPSKTDGTACEGGDACTEDDTCQGGTCTSGTRVCAEQRCVNLGLTEGYNLFVLGALNV